MTLGKIAWTHPRAPEPMRLEKCSFGLYIDKDRLSHRSDEERTKTATALRGLADMLEQGWAVEDADLNERRTQVSLHLVRPVPVSQGNKETP